MCGIIQRYGLDTPDIGFALMPQFYGQGYAYEIANATLQYATNTLKLEKVAAITVAKNVRSIKLLEKIGLRFSKTMSLHGSTEELLLYSN